MGALLVAIGCVDGAIYTASDDRRLVRVVRDDGIRNQANVDPVNLRRVRLWRAIESQGRCQMRLVERPITIALWAALLCGQCRGRPVPHGRGSDGARRLLAGDRASAGIAISRALVVRDLFTDDHPRGSMNLIGIIP